MSQDEAQQVSAEIPPAAQLMQMIFGFMTTQAISVAARLSLADLLKDGAKNADELAQATGTQARPLYRILRALASVGIFAEDDAGRFRLTPLAKPLQSDTPESLRDFSIFIGADWHWRAWGDLFGSAETGQPAFERIYGKAYFDYLGENAAPAQIFNDAMTSLSTAASAAVADGYDFTGINRLVDVGGGHGMLLSSILEKYPQMSGALIDAPSVIAGTKEAIEARGLAERCDAVGGDFFVSVPAGGDAYIMKHIIHDWNNERASAILQNCHRKMPENGKLLVVEIVIPEGNVPSLGKLLDLEMLVLLHSYERTEAEYRELFERSGFRLTRIVPTKSAYSVIEGTPL
ncbi:MAG: acetylserotonin O-methyltransferase [Nitrosospira sp.]|nr:acetylserotonin O-methyltransferase [Nitrosospira sp.]